MSTVSIQKNGSEISITSPYHSLWVAFCKRRNGKWRNSAWVLDARDESAVREALLKYFGTDGIASAPTCSLRVTFVSAESVYCGPVAVAGRTIARASGRDSGARIGDGVIFESGKPTSGGSAKNWTTVIKEGSVALVRDFPLATAEKLIADHPDKYEIVHETPASTPPADALTQAVEAGIARINSEGAAVATDEMIRAAFAEFVAARGWTAEQVIRAVQN